MIETMTLEEWKAKCTASSHVHKGETVTFHGTDKDGCIRASNILDEARSILIGVYFTQDRGRKDIKAGSGWYHP